MKSILMSIRPEWVTKILNGEKTIEIRKRFPKDYVGWVYIYCTINGGCIAKNANKYTYYKKGYTTRSGKVVARFWCDKVDIFHILPTERIMPFNRNVEPLLKDICLTKEEIMAYGNGDDYYAHLIHITKLEIFDKPKEISEFCVQKQTIKDELCEYCTNYTLPCKKCKSVHPLTRAPQSWCYIEL